MKLLPLLLLVGTPCWSVRAQSPAVDASPSPAAVKPEMPSGALLRPAPDFSIWEVTFTYPEDNQKQGPASASPRPPAPGASLRPRKIVTTKTGRIVREELIDLQNHHTELWFDGSTQYQKPDGSATWFQSTGHNNDGRGASGTYRPMPANGFRSDQIKRGDEGRARMMMPAPRPY